VSISEEFDRLRILALEAEPKADCAEMEPAFLGIIRLVQNNPSDRSYFVEQFIQIAVGTIPAPWEMAPYCMRELRFPEVRAAIEAHYAHLLEQNKHARYMNYLSHMAKAYDDPIWSDADMWPYFAEKELSQPASGQSL
jgi:hypothetical protein